MKKVKETEEIINIADLLKSYKLDYDKNYIQPMHPKDIKSIQIVNTKTLILENYHVISDNAELNINPSKLP